MIRTLTVLSFLFGLNAFALGPIPNGTYTGTEVCNVGTFPTHMVFADNTLSWDGQVDSFVFDSTSNGFFTLKSVSGLTGSGMGHFTESAIHYEVTYDYVAEDGSSHPAPGEVTLTYSQGKVHLESSASAGAKGKIACSGEFAVKP